MKQVTLILLIFFSINTYSQVYKDTKASVEQRVEDILSKMTLEEKLDYIGGTRDFYIRPVERLLLPEIKLTDGPVGTRNDGKSTAYPASILLASTWDEELARKTGEALGKDARARGDHILLAPGVNIYRAPMNGRNFEYFGEDPFLAGRMAVNYIRGVQSRGVVATVKHLAGNNQEWDRNHVSSDIDERTLHEIYLPAFKAAVQEAKVGAVMNGYNLLNGIHATQNDYLNNEILKNKWGFDGVLMSDWVSTYDGIAAAKGGLDLEMPSGAFMNRKNLLSVIKNGTLAEYVIDDKVRRILRMIFRFGFYDCIQQDTTIAKDNPQNAALALDVARNGIVLLKNQNNILPLKASEIKTLAVIGPNAGGYIAGGGSSYVEPFHSTSVLKGIQDLAANINISHIVGLPTQADYAVKPSFFTGPGSSTPGLKAEYFNNQFLKGKPEATITEETIAHIWAKAPDVKGIPEDHFSVRWTGVVRPEKNGFYRFVVCGDDGFRLWIDDKKVIDLWRDQGATVGNTLIELEAGKEYRVKLEYYENGGSAEVRFAWYHDDFNLAEVVKAASAADVAEVCVGFNETTEGEGFDRTFELPQFQDSLIQEVVKVNPNTVVILNSGGAVDMSKWLSKVKGLILVWYPGQEGGTAVAEILFGKTNPSGKLPASFEYKWADNPTFHNYYDPDGDKRVAYKEGLFVGYRYYDSKNIQPLFPFGFGLSYTSFTYKKLRVRSGYNKKSPVVRVSFKIKNHGGYDGAEAAQVYVRDMQSPVERPYKELKGFSKIFLKKGESKKVAVELNRSSFSYYRTESKQFNYDSGEFEILVGSSSKDIHLKKSITLKK